MEETYFAGRDGFSWFIGVVEDRNDPDKLGRVRVRCLGYHTRDLNQIPSADLPWAEVLAPTTSTSMNGLGLTPSHLVEGTWVIGFWKDAGLKQEPVIMGTLPGVPKYKADNRYGFSDLRTMSTDVPYPPKTWTYNTDGTGITITEYTASERKNYPDVKLGESDTNRLARNDSTSQHEIVLRRSTNRDTDIPTAEHISTGLGTDSAVSASTFNEPTSDYGSTYPYNHVSESESGHIFEVDDTPTKERLTEFHRTGTGYEINSDGTKNETIVGDSFTKILENEHIHVEKDSIVTIDKGKKIYVNKDGESGNDLTIQIGDNGSINISVDSGDVNLNVQNGNVNKKINGNLNETITGNVVRTVSGNVTETISGSQTTNITGTLTETAATGNLTFTGGSVSSNGIVLHTHLHTGITPGPSNTGGPTQG